MEIKYKFRDLKTYASTETFEGDSKKYRRVFENKETTYIYCELSFYNKLFDEEDWSVQLGFKAYSIKPNGTKEELCSLKVDRHIRKEENIVLARNSWGMAEQGMFWKKGAYEWEAYIDGKLVGNRKFYVTEGGLVSNDSNPYFNFDSIKMYEGGYDGVPKEQRKYYTQFNGSETRYIFAEFNFKNLHVEPWHCELFFNFYNDARQLKGSTSYLSLISTDPANNLISVTTGWGATDKNTWFKDKYTLEIVFMDTLIAILPFEVGESWVQGVPQVYAGGSHSMMPLAKVSAPQVTEESIEEVMTNLHDMIGLKDIKSKINDYTSYLKFLQLRQKQGFEENNKISLHTVFTGNPGTGKTTVAQMLGKIYHKMGLLTKGTVMEVGRVELIGKYIGQTAPKVKEVIEKARGGILFIDEAYSLMRSENDEQDFGREAIEVILKEMSDGPGDLAIIVAGYPKQMQVFLDSNPGLRSRFNLSYHFPDYLPQELMEIAMMKAEQKNIEFAETARAYLYEKIIDAYRNRNQAFGNARLVNAWVEEAKMNMGLRVIRSCDLSTLTQDQLKTIELTDIQQMFKGTKGELPDIKIDERQLLESMEELNDLVGLANVKNELHELVKLVKFYNESGKDVIHKFSLHTVFTGNPGTGKTTVARIMAKIFKALGILERGHLVECDRQSLVAGFIGQTAIKTQAMIDKAIGGVLFIDEAYSLLSGSDNDFGKEAIETLLKQMEDRRGEFIVITAGYPSNMNYFLEANPGLKSRFDKVLHFDDYSAEELHQVAVQMLKTEHLTPDETANEHLKLYLDNIYSNRDKFFGNARAVRKIIQGAVKKQHLRMASIEREMRTDELIHTLSIDDLNELKVDTKTATGGIGFKLSK
ncbi:AAA family ATPase [Rhodocytophaga aerolata]|uniref:AAA family ATPase n=1 Tax=Rhodocytophaga aerolata TaxID=455078 RepID=A0ABT8RAI4_9BACT|nr:AAA family ATPase [Rhodocytophaga aerolata]MDO1448691.1 AAA family ATPase [Rhodocytophaga aerolata]